MSFQVTDRFHVRLGGNTFIDTPNLVMYDGTPIFQLRRHEDGYLGIDFDIYGPDGTKIAAVRRNQLYFTKDVDRGSFAESGTVDTYEVREVATGRVLCSIKKRKAAGPAELDVAVETYLPNGQLLKASPTEMQMGGITMVGNTFERCWAAIAVGSTGGVGMGVSGPPRT